MNYNASRPYKGGFIRSDDQPLRLTYKGTFGFSSLLTNKQHTLSDKKS